LSPLFISATFTPSSVFEYAVISFSQRTNVPPFSFFCEGMPFLQILTTGGPQTPYCKGHDSFQAGHPPSPPKIITCPPFSAPTMGRPPFFFFPLMEGRFSPLRARDGPFLLLKGMFPFLCHLFFRQIFLWDRCLPSQAQHPSPPPPHREWFSPADALLPGHPFFLSFGTSPPQDRHTGFPLGMEPGPPSFFLGCWFFFFFFPSVTFLRHLHEGLPSEEPSKSTFFFF